MPSSPNQKLKLTKPSTLTLTYEEDSRYKPPVRPVCWIIRPKLPECDEKGVPTSPPDVRYALLWTRFWMTALKRGGQSLGLSPDSCYAMSFSENDSFKLLLMVPLDKARTNPEFIEPILGEGPWTGPAPVVMR